MRIYNITGALVRELVSEDKSAGYYTAGWNGIDHSGKTVASGMYFIHVYMKTVSGKVLQERMKMMVIK